MISKIISILFEKYEKEIKNYYSIIIPKFVSIIKSVDENILSYNKLFILFFKNNEKSSYFRFLYEEIKHRLYEETNIKNIYDYLCIIEQICANKNSKELYPSIIVQTYKKMENILSDYSFDLHDLIKKMEYFLKSGSSENLIYIKELMRMIEKNSFYICL